MPEGSLMLNLQGPNETFFLLVQIAADLPEFPCFLSKAAPYAACAKNSRRYHCLRYRDQSSRYGPTRRTAAIPQADQILKETYGMANGTVKWFNTTKGFGFIAPEEGGKDVFVHISAVERSGLTGLADDQKVTYDIEAGRDGRESAVNLVLV
jgi:CspA family cold shock protein